MGRASRHALCNLLHAMREVLIIDDELPLLKNLTGYLSSFPDKYRVRTAADGETGLEILGAADIDVLLTDVRLPGIDGIELVRRAREIKPSLPVIVMTAFASEDVRQAAYREGALRFVEKPLDLTHLRQQLEGCISAAAGWSGFMGGLTIFDIVQLLSLSGMSRVMEVRFRGHSGVLVFENGKLMHASTADVSGEKAFYRMAEWTGGSFKELEPEAALSYTPNLRLPATQLMMEAARICDEARRELGSPGTKSVQPKTVEETMDIKSVLSQFSDIVGFQGAAVFSPQGELMESVSNGKLDIKSIGMHANNALLNAQKATDQMGVGRGNMMQIRAPQATVLMRCLNEATDFAATKSGKAHFHTVVVMDPEGNTGMASMTLDRAAGKIAELVR